MELPTSRGRPLMILLSSSLPAFVWKHLDGGMQLAQVRGKKKSKSDTTQFLSLDGHEFFYFLGNWTDTFLHFQY